MIRNKLLTKTRDEWVALAQNGEFCVTPVNNPEEVLENDMTKESGMLETRREDLGEVTYLKPAVKLSDTPCNIRFRGPYAGEHNRKVLGALGYSDEEIVSFKEKGII